LLHTVKLQTERHEQMVDITHQIESLITQEQVQDGIALIYCPHTTAAITINENADPMWYTIL